MKFTNESSADRIIRVVLGVVMVALAWGGFVTGGLGTSFILVGVLAMLTGIVGFCPAYALFKFSTNKAK